LGFAPGREAVDRLAAALAALTFRACPVREPALRLPAEVLERADLAAGLRRLELPEPFAIPSLLPKIYPAVLGLTVGGRKRSLDRRVIREAQ
jgi:hypothetical protein